LDAYLHGFGDRTDLVSRIGTWELTAHLDGSAAFDVETTVVELVRICFA
jgi:hypothetical protein